MPVRHLDDETVLRGLVEGIASETGEAFFEGLVKNLSAVIGVRGAWVTEWLEESRRLRALAFWLTDQFVEEYEYAIAGTPCEPVIEHTKLVHVPDNVIDLYPNDPDLPPIGAVSYMGVPLLDLDGAILGHLAILDDRPLPKDRRVEALFRIFAARAAAELRRLRAESSLRRREATLARVINAAMDAIVDVDGSFAISHVNAAAEKIFASSAGEMLGTPLGRRLEPASLHKLRGLAHTLDERPPGERSSWVGGGLAATDSTGESFLAEATLSRSETKRGEPYYTLILRNVNERIESEQRIRRLTSETAYLRDELELARGFGGIIGRSPAVRALLTKIEEVADTNATVLLMGETGTGKELVARAIHAASGRHKKPMITINCAAIPEALIESELFGHEAGAFTGATRRREGRFSLADGGTIFLDEVGELPVGMQAKLLRVLQEGEFELVGSSRTHKVDARVLAATNRDLERAVHDGSFREDLYYRLAVFPITLPSLRERGDDVAILAQTFVDKQAQRMGRQCEPLSDDALRRLKAYEWPGNVRELQNVIERAVITARNGHIDLGRALPRAADDNDEVAPTAERGSSVDRILTASELHELERANLIRALEATSWRISGEDGAAHRLAMNASTLRSRMKAHDIQRSE